jgi:drug/metabolite transporter (DMT)-like permease
MIYLGLAVACSLAIGMIFKYAGREEMDRTALLTVNYLAAVAVAVGLLALGGRSVGEGLSLSSSLIGLGVGTGALLIAGFFVLMVATDVAGMSLAIGVMRVSVVIPFMASWLVWNEVPTPAQGVGLVLAGVAFFLIARKEQDPRRAAAPEAAAVAAANPARPASAGAGGADSGPSLPDPADLAEQAADVNPKVFGVLALTFLAGGAVDVTMKTFEEIYGAANSRVLFLLLAFGIAFLIGAAVVLWRGVRRGIWPDRRTIGWGLFLGVINYGSLEFILRAIERLPGTVVFPVNNIAIVLLAAVLGITVWDEHLSRLNRIGLGCAVAALVLLNL